MIKIYDSDEQVRFSNEVEKLNLLNQIMEEIGEQDFIVKVIESFVCDIEGNNCPTTLLCIVMEHLEMSLADYMANDLPSASTVETANNSTPFNANANAMTLEYSISEEESACLSIDEK